MLKRLVVLSALAIGTVSVAFADPVTGYFSATGTDSFTSSTVTFTPGSSTVQGEIGGIFATYLTDGNAVNFLAGALPYVTGANTAPAGLPPLFTTTEGGETFDFNIASYDADYVTNGTDGCAGGDTCLIVTGDGNFTGSGAATYSAAPATFVFTSQYAPGQPLDTITSFSASSSVVSAVPEPASLALFGTGLLGFVGFARRKFAA